MTKSKTRDERRCFKTFVKEENVLNARMENTLTKGLNTGNKRNSHALSKDIIPPSGRIFKSINCEKAVSAFADAGSV